jgi:hypothetical protein
MTIAATVLTASQSAAKVAFAPTSVGRFVKVIALPGAKHVESGIYFVESHRGARGCNGNSWLTLSDNCLGTVELGWREALFTEIASITILTSPADIAPFFNPATVEVSAPLLAPVSTTLTAPAMNPAV